MPSNVSAMPPQLLVTMALENTVGHVGMDTFVIDMVCIAPAGKLETAENPVEKLWPVVL